MAQDPETVRYIALLEHARREQHRLIALHNIRVDQVSDNCFRVGFVTVAILLAGSFLTEYGATIRCYISK